MSEALDRAREVLQEADDLGLLDKEVWPEYRNIQARLAFALRDVLDELARQT